MALRRFSLQFWPLIHVYVHYALADRLLSVCAFCCVPFQLSMATCATDDIPRMRWHRSMASGGWRSGRGVLLQRVLQWASPRNLPWISPGIELLSKKESSTTKDSNFLQMQLSLDSPLVNEVPLLRKRAVQSVDGKIEVVTPEETGIIDTIKSKTKSACKHHRENQGKSIREGQQQQRSDWRQREFHLGRAPGSGQTRLGRKAIAQCTWLLSDFSSAVALEVTSHSFAMT